MRVNEYMTDLHSAVSDHDKEKRVIFTVDFDGEDLLAFINKNKREIFVTEIKRSWHDEQSCILIEFSFKEDSP